MAAPSTIGRMSLKLQVRIDVEIALRSLKYLVLTYPASATFPQLLDEMVSARKMIPGRTRGLWSQPRRGAVIPPR